MIVKIIEEFRQVAVPSDRLDDFQHLVLIPRKCSPEEWRDTSLLSPKSRRVG